MVDLDSSLIVAAEIYAGDKADTATMEDSLHAAQTNLNEAGSGTQIEEVAGDKGYHSTDLLEKLAERTKYRTYIPEPKLPGGKRDWTKRSKLARKALEANRRRMKRKKGKGLQRQRSEKVERTFAHVLETGGGRRTWLRGDEKIRKRYSIATAAYNLGVVMRALFKIGTARGMQGLGFGLHGLLVLYYLGWNAIQALQRLIRTKIRRFNEFGATGRLELCQSLAV